MYSGERWSRSLRPRNKVRVWVSLLNGAKQGRIEAYESATSQHQGKRHHNVRDAQSDHGTHQPKPMAKARKQDEAAQETPGQDARIDALVARQQEQVSCWPS